MRINWLAIVVSAIAFFIVGGIWYNVFGAAWHAEMAKSAAASNPSGTMAAGAYPFVVSFVMALFLGYGLARVLYWRGDMNAARGAFIGLSLGLLIFGTMTWMDYAYEQRGITLGFINIGYVAIGMAIQGAILGAWRPKTASSPRT